jgi:hypothetical protein
MNGLRKGEGKVGAVPPANRPHRNTRFNCLNLEKKALGKKKKKAYFPHRQGK